MVFLILVYSRIRQKWACLLTDKLVGMIRSSFLGRSVIPFLLGGLPRDSLGYLLSP